MNLRKKMGLLEGIRPECLRLLRFSELHAASRKGEVRFQFGPNYPRQSVRQAVDLLQGACISACPRREWSGQAGAARSSDRRDTRGMSLPCQCMIRSGVLNHQCPWIRPALQSGHGVAAARQGIGRATRIGPSDGSQVVAGWKKGCSEFLILAMSPFLLPDQQGDRRPPVHLSAQPLSTGG